MKLPVALQMYSVRDDARADLEGTLKKVKEMGYDGVEFAGLYDHEPEEARALCEKYGLTPISAHVPLKQTLEMGAEDMYRQYQTIGCKFVVIPHISTNYCKQDEDFSEFVEICKTLGNAAKNLGMQLCYHNHNFEFNNKIDGRYMLDVLYETVSPDLLETELDTCWVNFGGEDPVKYVRKYAGRCRIVHLKDFVGKATANMYSLLGENDADDTQKAAANQEFEYRPLGCGLQNIPAIVEAAKESGAQWLIVEQDQPSAGKTPMECAQISIDYLRTLNQ